MLHGEAIPILKGFKGLKNQELPPFDKFVIEVLIFRSSRSDVFQNRCS